MANQGDDVQMNMETEVGDRGGSGLSAKQRILLLLRPFINFRVEKEKHEFCVTVVPESLRTYFYIFFYSYVILAIAVTYSDPANWDITKPGGNLIQDYFGANNICIFWDNPPFAYMAAFCFIPVIAVQNIYLIFDGIRVYFNYSNGKYPKLTKRFYHTYIGFSAFTSLGVTFFIQSFATQPDQYMPMHAIPFLFMNFGLWTMSFFHLLYFLKIGVIERGKKWYYLGIAYLVGMGITVVLKALIDAPNAFGAHTFDQPGLEWTGKASGVNDKFFMVFVTIMPFVIYYIFAEDLDHIQITFKCVHGAVKQS